jgi:hypothetical protein
VEFYQTGLLGLTPAVKAFMPSELCSLDNACQ